MILNDNIRFIIYTYYTYTDAMLEQFKEEWKIKIKKVNKLFEISKIGLNMYDSCNVCCTTEHNNWECPKYYYCIHIINTLRTE